MPPQESQPTLEEQPQHQPVHSETPQHVSSNDKTNGTAIAALVLAFLVPFVGFILSLFALSQIKKRHEKGHGLALAALIISIILTIIGGLITVAIVIASVSGIQSQARDNLRKIDVTTIGAQVEKYYEKSGTYPTLAEINDGAWRATNMPGQLDDEALRDPKNVNGSAVMTAQPVADTYVYAVVGAGGVACDNKATPCLLYRVTAVLEDGEVFQRAAPGLNQ